ncbi:MAG: PDZ domain-containing protein [Planctomycetia bacterium]|nr:PDZ domain-containing protein [Planctomycetia bacterium]
MTKKALKRISFILLGTAAVASSYAFAQTTTLKQANPIPKVVSQLDDQEEDEQGQASSTFTFNAPQGAQSYSVVIENKQTPDGKTIQTKKTWVNGELVEEEEKEVDPNDINQNDNATIQLPNGMVAPGHILRFGADDDLFNWNGANGSPFDVMRQMEQEMRQQHEHFQAQIEALRRQIANERNGLQPGQAPTPQNAPNQAQLKKYKYWIGLTIEPIPEIVLNHLPMEQEQGVWVQYVMPNSPAAKAGIKRYDVLHKINDVVITNPAQTSETIEKIGAKKVKVEVFRKGKPVTLDVEIQERPATLNELDLNLPQRGLRVVRPGLILPSEDAVIDTKDADDKPAENAENPENDEDAKPVQTEENDDNSLADPNSQE